MFKVVLALSVALCALASAETSTSDVSSPPEDTVCGINGEIKVGPVSDGVTCSGYYSCRNFADGRPDRHPEHFTCHAGTFFDKYTSSCRESFNIKCSLDRCDIKGGKCGNDVIFADQLDCTKFSRCLNGSLISYSCANGTAWDYQQGNCRDISQAACCSKPQLPKPEDYICGTNGKVKVGLVLDGVSCSGYYFCRNFANGNPDRQPEYFTCRAGTFFDKYTSSCRESFNIKCSLDRCDVKGGTCGNDVIFADQLDCTKFSRCLNGSLISYSCANGTAWDYQQGNCRDISQAACCSKPQLPKPEDYICGTNGKVKVGLVSDGVSCSGYYFCRNFANGIPDRQPEYFTCRAGMFFDKYTSSCRESFNIKCSLDRCDVKGGTCGNDVIFADQLDCTKFSRCLNGSLTWYTCGNGTAWDYQLGNCRDISQAACCSKPQMPKPEDIICGTNGEVKVGPVSDGVSCNSYYYCRNYGNGIPDRQPEYMTCRVGTLFDTRTLSCENRLYVKCSLDRCVGMGDKSVLVSGDCNAYAVCSNGVMLSYGKCPNNYYFDERVQSCTPYYVPYPACAA